jgi:hypothetical protein
MEMTLEGGLTLQRHLHRRVARWITAGLSIPLGEGALGLEVPTPLILFAFRFPSTFQVSVNACFFWEGSRSGCAYNVSSSTT